MYCEESQGNERGILGMSVSSDRVALEGVGGCMRRERSEGEQEG